jgi:hypothetical protein
MAGKVFFRVSMSLDGFIAPESVPVEDFFAPEKQDDPQVQRRMAQWMELQQWIFPQRFLEGSGTTRPRKPARARVAIHG